MDIKSKERFAEIVRKEPEALSQGDIDFLRARRTYLSASDKERYKDILGEQEDAPVEKPKKK